ncbi:MAG: hypothetical protein ACRDD8_11690 [Bacteroidales bacterium]
MAKAKRVKGHRITSANQEVTLKKIKTKGRPPGTKKKRSFVQTRLGCLLFYAAPIEYKMIMESFNTSNPFPFPQVEVVEVVMRASNSLIKDTETYRLAYRDFLKYGKFPPREWKDTPARIKNYVKLAQRREKYLLMNSKRKVKEFRGLSGK